METIMIVCVALATLICSFCTLIGLIATLWWDDYSYFQAKKRAAEKGNPIL